MVALSLFVSLLIINMPPETASAEISNPTTETIVGLKAPEKPFAERINSTTLKLSWKKVDGVPGYIIYRYNSDTMTYKRIARAVSPKTSWTDKNLMTNKVFKYKVRSYKTVNGKEILSPYTYAVTAKTHLPNAREANATSIHCASSITIGLREVFSFHSVPQASDNKYHDGAKVINKKLYYKASNSNIKVSKTGKITGLKFGTSKLIIRAHNGLIKEIPVTVKDFSQPEKFVTTFVEPVITESFLKKHKQDITDIAHYFLTHPKAGTGFLTLGDDGGIDNKSNIKLGNAEAAISNLLAKCPYWITIDVGNKGVSFQIREDPEQYYPYWVVGFSYFDDLTEEEKEYVNMERIAPRWKYYYIGYPT